MATSGKLQLVVSSEKVLARIEKYEVRFRTSDGQLHVDRRTMKIYEHVFDAAQTHALGEARELAGRSGLALEVTDLSRLGLFGRLSRLGSRKSGLVVRPRVGSLSSSAESVESCQDNCDGVTPLAARP